MKTFTTLTTLSSLVLAFGFTACVASTADVSDDSFELSGDEGGRAAPGKADDIGLPGACGGITDGQSPDGCWCDDECCLYADCCIDDRMAACFGTPADPPTGDEVSCNDGAMLIRKMDGSAQYEVVVADPGVAQFFIDKSNELETRQVSYSGQTANVTFQKSFPWQVSVEYDGQSPQLRIQPFTRYDQNPVYSTAGPPGTTVRTEGQGMRLSINNAYMPSSHTVIYYNIGEWLFESCTGS